MIRRRRVEETPCLTMTSLRRAGLFRSDDPVIVDLADSGESVRAQLDRDRGAVLLKWLGGMQDVPLSWAALRYGFTPLFAPEDGPRCTRLYRQNSRFAARQTLGLAYVCQFMSAEERAELRLAKVVERLEGSAGRQRVRRARRARLLDELRVNAHRLNDAAWAQLDAEAERTRARRRRRPLKSDGRMSTRWALLRGRISEPRFTSAEVLQRLNGPPDMPIVHPARGLIPVSCEPAPKRNAAELDVRLLRARPGRARGHKLSWGAGADGRVVLAAILGEGSARRLALEIWTGDGMAVARQEIAVTGGRRAGDVFLSCPATGRRVLKLYLRVDRFASREAQRLR